MKGEQIVAQRLQIGEINDICQAERKYISSIVIISRSRRAEDPDKAANQNLLVLIVIKDRSGVFFV